jgi:hypothetical protein
LTGLLRQSVFGRLAGYEDVNDADRLCDDPAMGWVVGDRAISGSAASANQMGRFETKWLSQPENLAAFADPPGQWIGKVHRRRPPKTIVLDLDSSRARARPMASRKAAPTTGISAAPAGRGRGITADVRRHPGDDRPAADTIRAGMRDQREQMWLATTAKVRVDASKSAHQRFGAPNRLLRSPSARAGCDLPLPKPFRGAILASQSPGIWRMSVKRYSA